MDRKPRCGGSVTLHSGQRKAPDDFASTVPSAWRTYLKFLSLDLVSMRPLTLYPPSGLDVLQGRGPEGTPGAVFWWAEWGQLGRADEGLAIVMCNLGQGGVLSSGGGKPLQLTARLGAVTWCRARLVWGRDFGPVINAIRVGKHRWQCIDDCWPVRVRRPLYSKASLLSTGDSSLPYWIKKSSLGFLCILKIPCADSIFGEDLSFYCFVVQTGAQKHSVICVGSLSMSGAGLGLRPHHVLGQCVRV